VRCLNDPLSIQVEIEAAVARLSPQSQLDARWEIARLPNHLEAGERVRALARADSKNETGLLVATDKRLFFLNTEAGSYGIKQTNLIPFAYDDVGQVAFDGDGVVITPRHVALTSGRRRALMSIGFGAVVGAGVAQLLPLSDTGGFLVGATTGAAAVIAAQLQIRRSPLAGPGWIAWLSGLTLQQTLTLKAVPPPEAAALFEYVGNRGGPLEDRVVDLADVRTRAAVASGASSGPSGQPERWAVALLGLGAALALVSIVAFLAVASIVDLCESSGWLWGALLLLPPLSAVLVAIGYWGTRSATVRNRGGWAWVPVGAAFIFVWLGSTGAC
jgi:hypothetical protein